ncbi:MAG: MBL fold metallo-hydrolase, partial [Thermoplasmata archaeon]|nr:MBL fold metallo-hydrolase [Thermoplasmata archaeon]
PEDRELIVDNLAHHGLTPSSIDILINTHLHGDHCGNNSIFTNAKLLAHEHEAGFDKNTVTAVREGYEVDKGVHIIETPGHTRGSISVVVRNVQVHNTYVLAGDALPIQDNYLKWVPPGINFNPQLALESMRKIVEIADIVIPGHDRPFELRK